MTCQGVGQQIVKVLATWGRVSKHGTLWSVLQHGLHVVELQRTPACIPGLDDAASCLPHTMFSVWACACEKLQAVAVACGPAV